MIREPQVGSLLSYVGGGGGGGGSCTRFSGSLNKAGHFDQYCSSSIVFCNNSGLVH